MEQTLSATPPMFQAGGLRASSATETSASGASWPAIIGGAVVTASFCLILLALGAGLGLSAISPWSGAGVSATAVGTGAILWLVLMQVISGSLGGYLAGRLRVKWSGIHDDEVYFRDTAHGFLAWGLAFCVTVGFLATAGTVMVGAGVVGAGAASGKSAQTSPVDPDAYYVDELFRSTTATPEVATPEIRSEVGRIFAKSMAEKNISAADRSYVTQVLVTRTGVGAGEADKRLTDAFTTAQQAADSARKAVAHSLLWIFIAMLIGAFCASFAATIGGRQRDNVVLT